MLPLDALKIKMQISSEAYQGKTALDIIKEEGWTLYRGAGWTAARNAPGSFALFGISPLAYIQVHLLLQKNTCLVYKIIPKPRSSTTLLVVLLEPLLLLLSLLLYFAFPSS